MNQFTILVLLLVVFCYCGGKYCPSLLRQNKEILLGVVGGLVLSSFFGFKLEGHQLPGSLAIPKTHPVWDQAQVWENCDDIPCSALTSPAARRVYDVNCATGHGYETYAQKCQ